MSASSNDSLEPIISTPTLRVWRRFRRNRLGLLGLFMLGCLVLVSVLAPYISPHDPEELNLGASLLPPGTPGHPLGTDDYGMDLLSRLIWGGRISLGIGFSVTILSVTFGVLMGALSGYYGGILDSVIMRVVDIAYCFPFFILAIAIIAILGPSLTNVMVALALVNWIGYARVVRGEMLMLRETEYVESARAQGASDARIIIKHMLPNVMAAVLVLASLGMGGLILSAAGLSFLGLGAQPPTPEWGAMLNGAQPYLRSYPYLGVLPGVAIVLTVLSFNFVGDGLRDVLDPKLTR